MEQIATSSSLENIISRGTQNVPSLVDDVVYLNLIAYNKIKKTIVKQNQSKIRIDSRNIIIFTTKEHVLDTKRIKLTELL